MTIDIIRLCEQRLVNVWPAVSTMLMDGWVVRFAHGYSSRANSASAIIPGAELSEDLIAHIERLYREAGQASCVRITPLADAHIEPMLLARGYHLKDRSLTMILPLDRFSPHDVDARVRLEAAPNRNWLDGVSARQVASKRSADHLLAIVGQLRVPASFATLELDGKATAFAMAALDREWVEIGSVMVDAAYRGQGLGRAVVDALLVWATGLGAKHAFLQVDSANTAAVHLYRNRGFTDLYDYQTLVKA